MPAPACQINRFAGADARFDERGQARRRPQVRACPSASRALSAASLDALGQAKHNCHQALQAQSAAKPILDRKVWSSAISAHLRRTSAARANQTKTAPSSPWGRSSLSSDCQLTLPKPLWLAPRLRQTLLVRGWRCRRGLCGPLRCPPSTGH
jgi:hypothetical protein